MSAISIEHHPSPPVSGDWLAHGLRTAGLGLALGLGVQLLVLVAMTLQQQLPQPERLLADAAQSVVFAMLAFAALVAGLSVARGRIGVAMAAGFAGALLAVLVARSAQAAALGALIGGSVHGATPWLAALVKGGQFALLAAMLVPLARSHAGAATHALVGAAVGGLTLLLALATLPAAGDPVQRAVLELTQPTALALAAYFSCRNGVRFTS